MTTTNALLINGGSGGWGNLGSVTPPYYFPLTGAGSHNTTEAASQITQELAATYSFLSIYLLKFASAASSMVFRKNGAAGNQAVSASGPTGFYQDATHTDSTAVNDLIDALFTTAGLYTLYYYGAALVAATPYTLYGSQNYNNTGGQTPFSTSATYYGLLGGWDGASSSSSLSTRSPLYAPGIGSSFAAYVSAASSGTAGVQVRKNGANANQAVAISATLTGLFMDSTHTDSFAVADEAEISMISTNASGDITTAIMSFAGSTSALDVVSGGSGAFPASATNYQCYGSNAGSASTTDTEAETQAYCSFAMTAEFLRAVSVSNSATVVSRTGGVTGNLAISPTGSGLFVDTTHSDSVLAASLVNAAATPGGSTWNLDAIGISFNDGSVKPVSKGGLFPQSIP